MIVMHGKPAWDLQSTLQFSVRHLARMIAQDHLDFMFRRSQERQEPLGVDRPAGARDCNDKLLIHLRKDLSAFRGDGH